MIGCRVLAAAVLAGVLAATAPAQAPDLSSMDLVERSVPDGPVARVRGESISAGEYLEAYRDEIAFAQHMKQEPLTEMERLGIGLSALNKLIQRHILLQEARRRGLTVSEDELESNWAFELDQLRRRLAPGDAESARDEDLLAALGLTAMSAREELHSALLIEKTRAAIAREAGVSVTDDEIREFHEAHSAEMQLPELIHVKQIYVRLMPDQRADPGAVRQARERIDRALRRVRAGETFESVARDMSDGPFKDRGGDLGMAPASELPPFFIEQARTMAPGDLSDVIESEFGFHVMMLEDMKQGVEVSLEEAEPMIRQRLLAEKTHDATMEFYRDIVADEEKVQVFLDLERTLASDPRLRELSAEAPRQAQ